VHTHLRRLEHVWIDHPFISSRPAPCDDDLFWPQMKSQPSSAMNGAMRMTAMAG
jgi:hypothetical protein